MTECDRNICYRQDYNGGCENCPCNTDVGKITTAQVVKALQTVKDFCGQTDFDVCDSGQCVLRKWCNYTNNGNHAELPETWQIPQERTEEHEHD